VKIAASRLAGLVCILGFFLATVAPAEEIKLRPRYRAGDTYRLSLSVSTNTEASSKGAAGEFFEENVRLHYKASVLVLEVDGDGRPLRERHGRVSLTFERPGESGSLFNEGVAFEVERRSGLSILLGGEPLEAKLEKTVSRVLEKQFEYTLEPALLEPGRPVALGESWIPDESLTRRFLVSRGIRVMEFGDAPMATLQRRQREDGETELVIDYRVPIARLELTRMPPHTEASRSEALLEGHVRLASEPGDAATSSVSNLTLSLNGVTRSPAQSVPWSVRSTVIVEKSTTETESFATSGPSIR
jgi:hypothetical protein